MSKVSNYRESFKNGNRSTMYTKKQVCIIETTIARDLSKNQV